MPPELTTGPPTLRCERAVLRAFRPEDATARAELGQDAEVVRMFGGTPAWTGTRPLTEAQGRSWYRAVTSAEDARASWAIDVDDRFVGTARLHHIDEDDRKARYAVGLLDSSLLGRGLGREITRRVLRFAFEDLGLHRVDLRVLAYNERAIRCYLACGFVEEGRERESAYVDGQWHDDVIMGVLAHEVGGDLS